MLGRMVVVRELNHFTNADLSSFYLNISKDILYAARKDGPERRHVQWVLLQVGVGIEELSDFYCTEPLPFLFHL